MSGQSEGHPLAPDVAGVEIDVAGPEPNDTGRLDRSGAEASADPRHQLLQIEGLHQEVDRAEGERSQPVLEVGPSREHDHGDGAAALPRLQDREAVRPWQHDVEHHEVECLPEQSGPALVAVAREGGVEALANQTRDDLGPDAGIVLDDEDAGRSGHDRPPRKGLGSAFRTVPLFGHDGELVEEPVMNIGVLTSGGDAPGMNAAVRILAKSAIGLGHTVTGIINGYEGLLDGTVRPLDLPAVDGLSRLGGTVLGSARSKRFPTEAGQLRAVEQIAALGLDALVVIGGNGSLTGAHLLARRQPCPVIGIPASIDNDVGYTRLSIGVDTAVNTIVEACDRISDTAAAHRRAFVVEVMGRDCGYLAMRAGIAADADAILFAEAGLDRDAILVKLKMLLDRSFNDERGKLRLLVVKSEGLPISSRELVQEMQAHVDRHIPGVSVRETVLGHVVRGGAPSALDRLIAQRLAVGAVGAILDGGHDEMVAWDAPGVGLPTKDPSVRRIPLADVLAETRAMLDGTSPATRARVALLNEAEPFLAL